MKQKLIKLKGEIEIDKSAIIVGHLNIPFATTGGTIRQKINKVMEKQSNAIQTIGSDIHKMPHPKQ